MTSQSPRIYIYKITFDEVLYYYYGAHKEKRYSEYYMGSPVTHKWCWELYTPKKQILQVFDFTDEGWLEAQEIEKRIIKPFFNKDKWCLNEHCGGNFSLDIKRKTGKKLYEEGIGFHALTEEQRIENAKKGGEKIKELGVGIFALTKEQKSENSKKLKELGVGIHGMSKEEKSELGKKSSSQKWKCTVTGFISTPCGLSHYQKHRCIDKNLRERIS